MTDLLLILLFLAVVAGAAEVVRSTCRRQLLAGSVVDPTGAERTAPATAEAV